MVNAFYELLAQLELPSVAALFLKALIGVVYCIACIVIGLFISYCLRRLLQKFFSHQQKISPGRNYLTTASMVNSIIKYAAYFIIAAQILTVFGISPASIVALAGIGSLAIGLGAQGMISDLITGAAILFENQVKLGDWVEINQQAGEVEAIGLRAVRLRDTNGRVHIIPNSSIKGIINSSQDYSRAVVEIPMAYTESIDRIIQLLTAEMREAQSLPGIVSGPEVQGITKWHETFLTIQILATTQVGAQWSVERQLNYMIKRRFEQEGVAPPYVWPANFPDRA
ncbi:MAG: mechanosensitive ion channel family protein [Syntrophomonadaceae bacterium]|jgi:small conductance mechanosensitive channel|nr:mechanosensitive ion channel family protein [Syntrophomonadaceae bacterium]